jgi:transcriptional regulator with XRE-family HTH domain
MAIGDSLRQLREAKGMKPLDIATLAGIPVAEYARYESNRDKPNAYLLQKLANVLGTTVGDLREAVLEGECLYPPHETYKKQKGWYQAKVTVEGGVADSEGRVPVPTEKRRAVCCPKHYAELTDEKKKDWEPIRDP